MPTRRLLGDALPFGGWAPPRLCRDPDHMPAAMIVREPGFYEHICPSCRTVTFFREPERGSL